MFKTDTFTRLNTRVASIVGDRTARAFEALQIFTVQDLVRHVPLHYVQGSESSDLSRLQVGDIAAVVAKVYSVNRVGGRGRERLEVLLTDGKCYLESTFFGKSYLLDYWQRELGKGVNGIFVGKIGQFREQLQMAHPNFVMLDESGNVVGRATKTTRQMAATVTKSGMIGLYRSTSKLVTWQIAEAVDLALAFLDGIADPVPAKILKKNKLPALFDALRMAHQPRNLKEANEGIERLKFDESLSLQVAMARQRQVAKARPAPKCEAVMDGLLDCLDAQLPFELTQGQLAVSEQILTDMADETPMQRLLQGEVGSGKTVVALRAMCQAVDNGYQSVLLAPTEVLAAQHAQTIRSLLGNLGEGQVLGAPDQATDVVLLTGSMTTAEKRSVLDQIASGQAGIVIGTHALLADRVKFANVGLVVIDEQHRFGVEQRAKLTEMGELRPHELVMTATPIPRSVAMTVYGDLDVSTLTELPAGRSDVQTTVVDAGKNPKWLDRAWERAVEEVNAGCQVFVVCPKIFASDPEEGDFASPGAAVTETAESLAAGPLKGLRLEVLHGQLEPSVKELTMQSFADGQLDVLITTTVIEVGVDVPNATMMIVLDADRFGISQLHQLRGRIGRGSLPGLCLLVTYAGAETPAMNRLNQVASTRDGFVLAEEDLKARREGNVLGAGQSGRSALKLLQVTKDFKLILETREIAQALLKKDPKFENNYLRDMVTQTRLLADEDWLGRN